MTITPPLDLLAAAHNNDRFHESRYDDAASADSSGRLTDFRDAVKTSFAATNVGASKVLVFDDARNVLNGLQICVHTANGDPVKGAADFANRQGKWMKRRVAIEGSFTNGDEFIYLSLGLGGAGASGFGCFCIVISNRRVQDGYSACFPADSAQTYTDDDGRLRDTLLLEQIGSWIARSYLAAVKLADAVLHTQPSGWPNLVCGDDDYIEVVTRGPVDLKEVVEIRVAASDAARLRALSRRFRAGDVLDPSEQNLVLAYQRIRRWTSGTVTVV